MGGSATTLRLPAEYWKVTLLPPTRMRVSGSVIWPEAERNCLLRTSPSRPCHRLLPGDSQVWPRIPGKRGKGGVSAPRALARPRGDRKPGHRGLSLASTAQPRLGRKFSAGYIVEQETGHRRSRAVEQAAPDADPKRVCRDKWKLGQRAKVLSVSCFARFLQSQSLEVPRRDMVET